MYRFGVIPSPEDVRDYSVRGVVSLPKKHDLPVVAVRNQGGVGSCVAHTLASAQDMGGDCQHSTAAIYGNRATGQNLGVGMIPREALKNLQDWGNVPLKVFPGNFEMPDAQAKFEAVNEGLTAQAAKHKIKAYARLYTVNDIKAAIANNMPVALTVRWDDSSIVNEDGIILWGAGNYVGCHELLIVGYSGDYFKIQNSWGESWGINGYCWSHASGMMSSSTFVEAWAIQLDCHKDEEKKPDIIRRTLYRGKRGDDVAQMQSILIDLGYYLGHSGADGIFGKNTESAVKAYQAKNDLEADGIVGRKTWAQLDKDSET